jgi:Plasmid pRiA4b ORF-3-like protein
VPYPRCVTGKRACPPEDVGGVWGYAEFLKAIRNSRHPGHDEMLQWAGGAFDPTAFDLPSVNGMLELFEYAMAPRAIRRRS